MNKIYPILLVSLFFSVVTSAAEIDVVDSITVTPTTITNYDDVTIEINWSNTNSGPINAGDTFTVELPPQIQANNASTPMLSGASTVGTCDLVGSTITCTFSSTATSGTVSFQREFYESTATTTTTVPISFDVNGSAFTSIDITVSPLARDPDERLMKTGNSAAGDLEIGDSIEWYVRANCAGETINDFVFTDTIGLGHELDISDVWIEAGECNGPNGDFVANQVIYLPDPSVTVEAASAQNGGSITLSLSSTDQAFIMVYKTTVTAVQAEYINSANVNGNNQLIDEVTFQVEQESLSATANTDDTDPVTPVPIFSPFGLLLLALSIGAIGIYSRPRQ